MSPPLVKVVLFFSDAPENLLTSQEVDRTLHYIFRSESNW